jgi:hypothetical protein
VGVNLFKLGVLDADVDVEYKGAEICVDDVVASTTLELLFDELILFKSSC